jgi:TonB family protein
VKAGAAQQGDEPDEVRVGQAIRGPRRLSPVFDVRSQHGDREAGGTVAATMLMLLLSNAGEVLGKVPAVQAQETSKELADSEYHTPPKPTRLKKPKYPRAAFDNRIEGTVIVELLIDAKGKVAKARIIQSVPALDEAALECVKKWRFEPAKKAGKPVPAIANAPIAFRIK